MLVFTKVELVITKQFLFLSTLFFLTTSSCAFSFSPTPESACTGIDLRTEYPLKMRNQGNVSWCYAHAAADYLQFYNRIPEQISAADIAINYSHRLWPRLLRWWQGGVLPETGLIRGALNDMASIGYCPEEFFPSEKWTRRMMNGKVPGASESVLLGTALRDIDSMVTQVSKGIYRTADDLPFIYEFKGVSHQQFFDTIFGNSNVSDVIDHLRVAACAQHRKPFPREIKNVQMGFNTGSVFVGMNRVLDQHMPVTVDFFYDFLDNIDSFSHSLSNLHTTILVGRRFDAKTQECQYLIKNSYGTDCSEYDYRHQCDGGNIWVSEHSLGSAMTSFVYIPN